MLKFIKPSILSILLTIGLCLLALYSVKAVTIDHYCNCPVNTDCRCDQPFPYGQPVFKVFYYTLNFADFIPKKLQLYHNSASYLPIKALLSVLNLAYIYVLSCLLALWIKSGKE